jgi:hypothetical protein
MYLPCKSLPRPPCTYRATYQSDLLESASPYLVLHVIIEKATLSRFDESLLVKRVDVHALPGDGSSEILKTVVQLLHCRMRHEILDLFDVPELIMISNLNLMYLN